MELRPPLWNSRRHMYGYPPPGAEVAEVSSVPGCFELLSAVEPGMRLHDISSQAIVPLLDLQPGHKYLDLCAAPGNKTLQALEIPLALRGGLRH